jgi:two-component system nitrogen regulation response regulator GlnG
MSSQILLIHDDPELFSQLQKLLEKQGADLVGFRPKGANRPAGKGFSLVAVESTLEGLPFLKGLSQSAPVLVATAEKLKKHLLGWVDLLRKGGESRNGREPCLEDVVEIKLLDFIRKARAHKGKNLYNLLLQEFEKPLISLTLKETGGNQIQASQILGVNRNTLRKKIVTLKIPVVRQKVNR